MLEKIITGNFGIWILLLALLFIIIDNRSFDKKSSTLFLVYIILIFVMDLSDILDLYLSGFSALSPWRYATSIVGYLLRPFGIMINLIIYFRREKVIKTSWLFFFPFAIAAPFIITSPWTKWVFYFSDNNYFVHGWFWFLPQLISGLYMAALFVATLLYSSKTDKVEVIVVIAIGVFAVIAMILETELEFKFLIDSAMAVACTTYYLYFYLRRSRVDDLKGLYNRNFFFVDMDKFKNKGAVIISIDLNGLKEINDQGGHAAGDEDLRTLSSCLVKAFTHGFRGYRTGGDEFVVVSTGMNLAAGNEFVARAKMHLSETPHMASFGVSTFKDRSDFPEALKNSDGAMYEDKKNYKHR